MLRINNKNIGSNEAVYLIAEIGSNHNQDKNRALEMIDMAAESGADAVKFQSILFNKLYQPNYETTEFKQWFKKIELNERWYHDLAQQAQRSGIDFLSAPTYLEAVDLLEQCHVPAYKLASPQVQGNLSIVKRAAQTQKPLIMSLGYCEQNDIQQAIATAQQEGNQQIALLHCVSSYPMNAQHANLRFINTLQQTTGCPIGFSDHSLDDHLAIAAVAMGACIIEKHVTQDRTLSGPDHHFAMTFSEYQLMVKRIRETTQALGNSQPKKLLDEVYQHRNNVALKLFTKQALKKGDTLKESDIMALRHAKSGLTMADKQRVINQTLQYDIAQGELLTLHHVTSDINS